MTPNGYLAPSPNANVRNLRGYAHEQVTVSTGVSTLDVTKYGSANGAVAWRAVITVSGAPIRYTYDGTQPTTSLGHWKVPTDTIELLGYDNIANFKATRDADTDSTLDVTYER